MAAPLEITAEWERLEHGPSEERACFGAVGVLTNDGFLTRVEDELNGQVRDKAYLSAYDLAEWFAWNWWRQRWESRSVVPDWDVVHRMGSIVGGYVWPDITVVSDGERVSLMARPTRRHEAVPLHCLSSADVSMRMAEFDNAVSDFVERVLGRLHSQHLDETNLKAIWADIRSENAGVVTATRRRIEARLGLEPDAADEGLLDRLIEDSRYLGACAVEEIAAMSAGRGFVPTKEEIMEIARRSGAAARPGDAVRLDAKAHLSRVGHVSAWRRGTEAARMLRTQERLGASPVPSSRLAEMVGVSPGALEWSQETAQFSFGLDHEGDEGRIVLRPRTGIGRRFDLARLLGDRMTDDADERLFPATPMHTYRQGFQRSFAAELLCPFDALEEALDGDYGDESREDAAEHFMVSPLVVDNVLAGHAHIQRTIWATA